MSTKRAAGVIKREPREVFVTTNGREFTHVDQAMRHQGALYLEVFLDREGVRRGGEWTQSVVRCAPELVELAASTEVSP